MEHARKRKTQRRRAKAHERKEGPGATAARDWTPEEYSQQKRAQASKRRTQRREGKMRGEVEANEW